MGIVMRTMALSTAAISNILFVVSGVLPVLVIP